ncbi:MAG: histidine kinase dimerization/phospho-acceptor domain-containing protein [Candidatus Electryonea clarkiae]|nr:histidine kinase dimerization/phospho-acceptor domain-containing protein [Candidatus Electryonea clarkiae]MDP8286594.1 histidine kinase dimerization/phospho-acceptor domain-containing protein [Candidatus Electryonea clarkiae]
MRWSILIAVLSIILFTNPTSLAAGNYALRIFDEDEVPNIGDPLGIMQDSRGFIWFWGSRGAVSYDGNRFIRLNEDNGLLDNYCYTIRELPGKGMLICTYKGVVFFDFSTGDISTLLDTRNIPIRDVEVYDNCFFLAGDAGLLCFFEGKFHIVDLKDPEYPHWKPGVVQKIAIDNEEATLWASSEILGIHKLHIPYLLKLLKRKDDDNSVTDNEISILNIPGRRLDIFETDIDYYDINNKDERLKRWKETNKIIESEALSSKLIFRNILVQNNSKTVYASQPDGLYRLESNILKRLQITNNTIQINTLSQDINGNILVASSSGLFYLTENESIHFSRNNGLLSEDILACLSDQSGFLWFIDNNGILYRLANKEIEIYSSSHFENLNGINRVIPLDNGSAFIGGERGITLYKEGDLKLIFDNKIIHGHFVDFTIDKSDNLLIATSNGLYQYRLKENKLNALIESEIGHTGKFNFSTAPDSNVWFVLFDQLREWDGININTYHIFKAGFEYPINVYAAPDGSIFSSGWVYLTRYLNKSVWLYEHNNVFYSSKLTSLVEFPQFLADHENQYNPDRFLSYFSATCGEQGPDDAFWFGTFASGIVRIASDPSNYIDGDSIHVFDTRNGLPGNKFNSVFKDDDGNLYFISERNVCKVSMDGIEAIPNNLPQKASILDFKIDHKGRKYYVTSHGLFIETDRFNFVLDKDYGLRESKVLQIVFIDDNEVIAVQPNGVFVFNPEELSTFSHKVANPGVSAIWIDSTRIPVKEDITFPLGKRACQLDISFPDYFNENYNRFSWQLANFDENYQPQTDQDHAIYTNLPPGKHLFHLRGWNGLGQMSNLEVPLTIVIPHYFYETQIFRITIAILLLVVIYFFISWRVRQLGRKKVQQLEIEAEKLRTVRKLAAAVAHEFNNPLAVIRGSVEIAEMDGLDSETSKKFIAKIPEQVDRMKHLVAKLLAIKELKEMDYAAGEKILDIHKSSSDDDTSS